MASEDAVHDNAMPISAPESTSIGGPLAASIASMPRIYRNPPVIIAGRRPYLSANAPTGAWNRPQVMFCTATANVKSAAVNAMSWVIGGRNRPRLCRMPMPRLIMIAAPAKITPGLGSLAAPLISDALMDLV